MPTDEASLLQTVVVIPAAVVVHLHTVLLAQLSVVDDLVGLTWCPVHEAQTSQVSPAPAN